MAIASGPSAPRCRGGQPLHGVAVIHAAVPGSRSQTPAQSNRDRYGSDGRGAPEPDRSRTVDVAALSNGAHNVSTTRTPSTTPRITPPLQTAHLSRMQRVWTGRPGRTARAPGEVPMRGSASRCAPYATDSHQPYWNSTPVRTGANAGSVSKPVARAALCRLWAALR